LITADALHTQTGHVTYLTGRGAHHLFTVKDNQPTLRRALAALPWKAAPTDRDPGSDRSHGRLQARTATVLDLDRRPDRQLFRGAQPAMRIVRRRTDAGTAVTSTETVYAITSLGHRYADAALLATWLRTHWSIANSVHWVRDVTFGEDHSQVRTGAGPQIMAALRNTAINISRLAGHSRPQIYRCGPTPLQLDTYRRTQRRPHSMINSIDAGHRHSGLCNAPGRTPRPPARRS
jgi:predicted transposase YbfD/YdcC